MASFDINFLFINIPLTKPVEICVKKASKLIFIPNNLITFDFKFLLNIPTKKKGSNL